MRQRVLQPRVRRRDHHAELQPAARTAARRHEVLPVERVLGLVEAEVGRQVLHQAGGHDAGPDFPGPGAGLVPRTVGREPHRVEIGRGLRCARPMPEIDVAQKRHPREQAQHDHDREQLDQRKARAPASGPHLGLREMMSKLLPTNRASGSEESSPRRTGPLCPCRRYPVAVRS